MKDRKLTAWNLPISVAVDIENLSNKNQVLEVPKIKYSHIWIISKRTMKTPETAIILFSSKLLEKIGLTNELIKTNSITLVKENDLKNSKKSKFPIKKDAKNKK